VCSSDLDFSNAIKKAALIARRWVEQFELLRPYFTLIILDDESRKNLAVEFANLPRGKAILVNSLLSDDASLGAAYLILYEWQLAGQLEGLWPLVNTITLQLFERGQYASAHLLFQNMLPDFKDGARGYVYNGSFADELTGNLFDWHLKSQSGVEFHRRKISGETEKSDGVTRIRDMGLEIRFLDSPVQFKNVSQFVRLVPGHYQLDIEYSTVRLKMPKPIKISIECYRESKQILSSEFESGSEVPANKTAGFVVPITGCKLQRIFLHNGFVPNSWQNLYRGTLVIHNVRIRLLES